MVMENDVVKLHSRPQGGVVTTKTIARFTTRDDQRVRIEITENGEYVAVNDTTGYQATMSAYRIIQMMGLAMTFLRT